MLIESQCYAFPVTTHNKDDESEWTLNMYMGIINIHNINRYVKGKATKPFDLANRLTEDYFKLIKESKGKINPDEFNYKMDYCFKAPEYFMRGSDNIDEINTLTIPQGTLDERLQTRFYEHMESNIKRHLNAKRIMDKAAEKFWQGNKHLRFIRNVREEKEPINLRYDS